MEVLVALAALAPLAPTRAAAAQPETTGSEPKTEQHALAVQKHAERSLTDEQTVALALRHSPDLTSAALAEKQAAYAVRAEEARYPLVLSANAGYTRSTGRAILAPDGSISSAARNTIVVGSVTTSHEFQRSKRPR